MSADEPREEDARDRDGVGETEPSIIDGKPVLRVDEGRRRRLRPWAIAGATTVVIVTGSVALSYTPVFGARVVEVEGEERLAPRQVLRIAGVDGETNVLHLDTTVAESRLEAEPWILDATVETRLPGTITISVRERTPVLVLVADDSRRLVAADGTALGRAPRSSGLPEMVPAPGATTGRREIEAAGVVVQAMAPTLRARIDSITVAGNGDVSLIVDGDVEVRYGLVHDASAKSQALRAILQYADDEGRGLLSVDLSAVAAPTARFVGSQQPISVPDPSADVPADADPPGNGAGGHDAQGSPSPSPSP